MKIKITKREPLTLIRMVNIYIYKHRKHCVGGYAKKLESLCTIGRNVKCCSCDEKRNSGSSKIKNRITIWSTSGYIPQRFESRNLKKYLYSLVHSGIIHNSWKVEAAQTSIDIWMAKQNLAYTHNEILFSLEKEALSETCYSMDETWGHYTKWNAPITKRKKCHVIPRMES